MPRKISIVPGMVPLFCQTCRRDVDNRRGAIGIVILSSSEAEKMGGPRESLKGSRRRALGRRPEGAHEDSCPARMPGYWREFQWA